MKKFLLLSFIFLLTFSAVATPDFSPEEQVPLLEENSAEVVGLNKLGILLGTGNGFELDRTITRAEAVVLLMRMHPDVTGSLGMPAPVFDDMDDHWAYKEVTAAKKIGLVNGTTATTFTPDRTVSGKEFAKMTLSLLGYRDVTIENAYELGTEHELLVTRYTSIPVRDNIALTRGDAARICWSALSSKTADGKILYQKLIDHGKYKSEAFDGVLGDGTPAAPTATFADKLNKQMPDDKNYMFSPLSIKMAFAMAANGASGETKSQIESALGITDLTAYNESAKALIEKYNQAEILQLNIANSIWINSSLTSKRFSSGYADLLKEYYCAQATISGNDSIVKDINGWVNEQTRGKIPTIINSPDFESMLINAVYFKGAWVNEFNKNATKPDIFTDRNGKEIEIDFMNRTAYFDYFNDGKNEIIRLPYKNVSFDETSGKNNFYDLDISMYLVNGEFSENVLSNATPERKFVALSMPKFKFEYDTSLKAMMQSLGVNDAFLEGKADFSKMFDSGNMFISNAIHKTYIDVDEKGTEAAAVTAIGMATSSLPPQPIAVKFDKPFTFVIKDNSSGEILFLGEYAFAK